MKSLKFRLFSWTPVIVKVSWTSLPTRIGWLEHIQDIRPMEWQEPLLIMEQSGKGYKIHELVGWQCRNREQIKWLVTNHCDIFTLCISACIYLWLYRKCYLMIYIWSSIQLVRKEVGHDFQQPWQIMLEWSIYIAVISFLGTYVSNLL